MSLFYNKDINVKYDSQYCRKRTYIFLCELYTSYGVTIISSIDRVMLFDALTLLDIDLCHLRIYVTI